MMSSNITRVSRNIYQGQELLSRKISALVAGADELRAKYGHFSILFTEYVSDH